MSTFIDGSNCDLIVFGGTFDPPTKGHVDVIRQLRERGHRHIIVAPTTQNPFKQRDATSLEARLTMFRMVLQHEGFEISDDPREEGVYLCDFEYERTYQLVEHLRKGTGLTVAWAVGPDKLEELPSWCNWDEMELPIVQVEERIKTRSTQARNGEHELHSCLVDFVEAQGLYSGRN